MAINNTPVNTCLAPDIVNKIRHIEIRTKRALRYVLPGGRRSIKKGRGLDFDQIGEYQVGDDVRCIDWPGSARTGTLLVRRYLHESSRIMLLVVDVSPSLFFSSGVRRKCDTIAQIASVMALIADHSGDAIGLLLFSDDQELYIRPGKGKAHMHRIMRMLYTHVPKGKSTSFDAICKKIMRLTNKNMIVVCVSDFVGTLDTQYVRTVARAHTMIAIRCLDEREQILPAIGFISMVDSESGELVTIDTRASGRILSSRLGSVQALLQERLEEQNTLFARYNIPVLPVTNDNNFIDKMVRFFKQSI